jgi:hypothetical protein
MRPEPEEYRHSRANLLKWLAISALVIVLAPPLWFGSFMSCTLIASNRAENNHPVYPGSQLVNTARGGASAILRNWYTYQTTDDIETVTAYFDKKLGKPTITNSDAHVGSVYTYHSIRWALSDFYCQVISLGECGMPQFTVGVWELNDTPNASTEIWVEAVWDAP